MKLTALIAFVACLQVSAHGVAQDRITFSGEDVPLEKVFSVIKKQTSYLFLYNDALLANAQKITIHVKNASVEEVLNTCFKNQPLSYTIKGKTIFIISRQVVQKKEVSVVNDAPPGDDIKGRITNAQGEPLSGANIVVKRTGKGTQANANGEFMLKNVGSEEMITITYTGYAPQTVKIGGSKNLMLVMYVADNELDEMVVQAYGTTTRRLATGNIAKVTAAEIERQPVMNPLQALQGRVAGLDIVQSSGYASAPFRVEIRGRNAIGNFPADPLYIIDGVPLTILDVSETANYPRGSSGFIQNGFNGPANGQSPLFNINPKDIESIEVLKDADATAIYGSRGANGVILITTKKGKAGKTQFDLNLQKGINTVTRYWDMLNTQQYLQMRREAFSNDGIVPDASNAYDLVVWDTTKYTDWQKVLYGGTGKNINMQAAVSGGDTRTTFHLNGGYSKSTNILTVSGADQRVSASFNLDHRTNDEKLTLSLKTTYSYTQSDMISLPAAIVLPPNAPNIYDQNGNLNYAGWTPVQYLFPFANLKQPNTVNTSFLNSSIQLGYRPFKNFSFNANVGFNNGQANQISLNPIAAQDPSTNPTGDAYFGNNNTKNWIIEPQATYNGFISSGKFSVLVGGSLQKTTTDGLLIHGMGFINDALLRTVTNAKNISSSDNYGEYKYAAIFGRISYNWKDKYLLNLNARRDGSSHFGPGSQFGNFGSVGIAWIFSEERFFKPLKFVSFGKIRASYGNTGSDDVGNYKYLTRWSSNRTLIYNNIQPLAPQQHANPNYHWQVNKKLEAAVDLGFFKDYVSLSVAYYLNRCGNQLISFPTPTLTGFTNVVANSPALVQNTGWEFTANAKILDNRNYKLSLSFNTAVNRNKLVAYPNIDQSPYKAVYVVGQPLNITKVLHYSGVNPTTGLYTYVDNVEDGQIVTNPGPLDDRFVQNLNPKFFGGVGVNFTYKTIQLNLFFVAKKQIGVNAIGQTYIPGTPYNQPVSVFANHWQKPGDNASIAKFTSVPYLDNSFINFPGSNGGYTDASYIRLSNVALNYNFSPSLLKGVGMKSCSLFLQASNLLTITNYKGIDPEVQNFGALPPVRNINAGLSLGF